MHTSQTQAIKRLLNAWTHADLAELYTPDMEVQVMAAQDDGSLVEDVHWTKEGKAISWRGFTDGDTTWKEIRIPYNAATNPTYDERPMAWALEDHCLGIGMTGWDFHAKVSRWVGFDFDAMIGHSQKHSKRLSDDELVAIEKAVEAIPWVTLRRSTGGKGLHLYVMLDNVPTETHTEHAALARAVLGLLSSATGHPLHTAVDVCGHILWAWHRKLGSHARNANLDSVDSRGQYVHPQGLRLVKKGCTLTDIPVNWREHIQVVNGSRKRLIPDWVKAENRAGLEKLFEELSGRHSRDSLDEDHLKLMQWVKENEGNEYRSWFDVDNHMYVTHTRMLEKAYEDKALGFKGVYKTSSTGSSTHNCFCYPLKGGSWAVRRYSLGVHEADTWTQDGNRWTRCYFNREPDLRTACMNFGGVETKNGSFSFMRLEDAVRTMDMLGTKINIKEVYMLRSASLLEMRDGRIHFDFAKDSGDRAEDMTGWKGEKSSWKRIFNVKNGPSDVVTESNTLCDSEIRHVIASGEDFGWAMKTDGWTVEPLAHVKIHLAGLGLKPQEEKQSLAACIANPWKLVNRPFEPEYPGEREWNRGAVQFKLPPSMSSETLSFPTWERILKHCGKGLDLAVQEDSWCPKNGILSGRDYLLHWIASLFQKPTEPLPYLFFYGQQNSGKSILHESIEAILSGGVVDAASALTNQSGFNGELQHAVLGVIEEINLAASPAIYDKLKKLITAKTMLLCVKHATPCQVVNTMHWIQCGNDPKYVPVFPNDTRVVVIKVGDLDPDELIPKHELLRLIEREGPDFVRYCLDLQLPAITGRLAIPVIETFDKSEVQSGNMSMVEQFIDEMCTVSIGNRESYTTFWERFKAWLPVKEQLEWSQKRMGRMLPFQHAKGKEKKSNYNFVVNLSFNKNAPKNFGPKLTVQQGFLMFAEGKGDVPEIGPDTISNNFTAASEIQA